MENLVVSSSDLIQQSLLDALMAGWINGATQATDRLPKPPRTRLTASIPGAIAPSLPGAPSVPVFPPPFVVAPPAAPPPTPPSGGALPGDEEPPYVPAFPSLRRAVDQLFERRVVSPDEFKSLSASARRQAFTITADLSAESISKLRDNLAETLEAGPSLKDFRAKVLETFEKLPIGEAHLENVYRSNVQEAFSQGMEHVLDHPLVGTAFPYRAYTAIHDARCREDHLALEKLGLDGTNVYLADDPTWRKFRPPWDFNCRCGWIALDIETAAGLGVRHAQAWLRAIAAAEKGGTYNGLPETVMPPRVWVKPPPFNPPPGWQRS